MTDRGAAKRQAMLDDMAAFVLENGLANASLRPLARAASTSDRMLIYHFNSKEALVAEVLTHLAESLAARFTQSLPQGRTESVAQCAREVIVLMRLPEMRGFMRLWFELAAGAATDSTAHSETGSRILKLFRGWIKERLPEESGSSDAEVDAALTLIEGIVVMEAFGESEMADRAIERFL